MLCFLFFSPKLLVYVAFLLNQDGFCVGRPIPSGEKNPRVVSLKEMYLSHLSPLVKWLKHLVKAEWLKSQLDDGLEIAQKVHQCFLWEQPQLDL